MSPFSSFVRASDVRIANHFLMIAVVLLAGYIMGMPFFPQAQAFTQHYTDSTRGYHYESRLAASASVVSSRLLNPPRTNTLVIPSAGIDAPILEGDSASVLNDGLWRRPHTSTPDKGGNTVITGHRFMYTSGPKTFYNLDQVEVGQKILLFWNGKEYDYEVYEKKVVEPQDTSIEQATSSDIITLYTCHPLWTSKQRLVVRAKQIVL